MFVTLNSKSPQLDPSTTKIEPICLITNTSCVRFAKLACLPRPYALVSIMNMSKLQIGSPGPFEVRFDDLCQEEPAKTSGDAHTAPDTETPRRRYDCVSYDRCLELAAALNWESFTCRGCSGQVNDALLWRAGQAIRRDSVAKAICPAPKISTLSGNGSPLAVSKETLSSKSESAPALRSSGKVTRPANRRSD